MAPARLDLTREQILAHRRRTGALDRRLAHAPDSLQQAAWAGLQDSMPRAALASISARVEGVGEDVWDDPHYLQVWGLRYSTYVIWREDLGIFTRSRLTDDPTARSRAEEVAKAVADAVGDSEMTDRELARLLGWGNSNRLRYGAPTGTIVIRWPGSGPPTVRSVPAPDIEPPRARVELARRYLHVSGPATPESFAGWAGLRPRYGAEAFASLGDGLMPVDTPIGEGWILAEDETSFTSEPDPPAPARLLPSGDVYWLLHGDDRSLLVPDARQRDELWTPRVWPGAVLVGGEIVGTWRRAQNKMTIATWRGLTSAEMEAVEAEANSLPIPGIAGEMVVRYTEA